MSGPAPGEVWLYKDGKYSGTCWKLTESHPDFDDLGALKKVSSLRVGPGTTVMLFEKAKFGGDSMEYNQDAPGLQRWNDKAASAKILREAPQPEVPGPGEVFVYRDGNFESFVWRLREACPDVAKIGAKKTISSIRVGPNTECVIYDDPNFTGKAFTVSKNSPSLGDWNDKAASIKIFKSS